MMSKERIGYQDIPKEMFEGLVSLEQLINNSNLGMQLLEIIRLRVAQLNGCAYCIDMHYKELKHTGESELRMYSLSVWKETNYYSEKEQAVLDFTEKLTLVNQEGVSDEVFQKISTHFDKEEISLLALAVAQINTWTRLMQTFRFAPGVYKVQDNSH